MKGKHSVGAGVLDGPQQCPDKKTAFGESAFAQPHKKAQSQNKAGIQPFQAKSLLFFFRVDGISFG
ncbi:MAG: hypothetical protein IJG08_09175 [Oscillospiraceae bacterium]|nr:hypothetical protein [Oscillospiraceae bacterium]MBR7056205.1 hypothetical protein [Oscillospiraceae bacterium]